MNTFSLKSLVVGFAAASSIFFSFNAVAEPTTMDAGIRELQHEWELIQYKAAPNNKEARFAELANKAHSFTQTNAERAEPHVWEGIVLSSWANAKGGLGALSIAKQAKAEYERAIAIDPKALGGSALSSLAVLYYKVPGWPIGFGDSTKASELFKQALAVNPDGIDTNYFYADYLVDAKRKDEAMPYLQRALQAAPRPGREIADAGRREEVRTLMEKIGH